MYVAMISAYGGEPDKGIEILRGLISKDPNNISLVVNLGQIYLNCKKEYAMALKVFEDVLLKDPENSIAKAGIKRIMEVR